MPPEVVKLAQGGDPDRVSRGRADPDRSRAAHTLPTGRRRREAGRRGADGDRGRAEPGREHWTLREGTGGHRRGDRWRGCTHPPHTAHHPNRCHRTHHRPRMAEDRPQGWRRAWHTVRATQRAHRAATGHDRGTGWAQIPIDMEDAPTAPTEAHTAPQTVGGCHSPPTARNAPHRARRSTTQGTAWHGGTASAPRPDPAPQMPHSTHTTAEPQSRKALIFKGYSNPRKFFSKKVKKEVDRVKPLWYSSHRSKG